VKSIGAVGEVHRSSWRSPSEQLAKSIGTVGEVNWSSWRSPLERSEKPTEKSEKSTEQSVKSTEKSEKSIGAVGEAKPFDPSSQYMQKKLNRTVWLHMRQSATGMDSMYMLFVFDINIASICRQPHGVHVPEIYSPAVFIPYKYMAKKFRAHSLCLLTLNIVNGIIDNITHQFKVSVIPGKELIMPKGTNDNKKVSVKPARPKSTPASAEQNKKAAKKSADNNSKQAKSRERLPENDAAEEEPSVAAEIFRQIVPYLLCCLALFITVCFIFTDVTGIIGGGLRSLLFGLFSSGAIAVPILIAVMAFFWRRDSAAGLCGWKALFSFIVLLFISITAHAFTKGTGVGDIDIKALWSMGLEFHGGGAVGGLIGGLLLRGIGKAGTLIVSFTVLAVFGLFLFGLTPRSAAVWIAYQLHEYREKTRIRRELDEAMPPKVRPGTFRAAQNEGLYAGRPGNDSTISTEEYMRRNMMTAADNPQPTEKPVRGLRGRRSLEDDGQAQPQPQPIEENRPAPAATFDAGSVRPDSTYLPDMPSDDNGKTVTADEGFRIDTYTGEVLEDEAAVKQPKKRGRAAAAETASDVSKITDSGKSSDTAEPDNSEEPLIDEAVFEEVLRKTESGVYLNETEDALEKAESDDENGAENVKFDGEGVMTDEIVGFETLSPLNFKAADAAKQSTASDMDSESTDAASADARINNGAHTDTVSAHVPQNNSAHTDTVPADIPRRAGAHTDTVPADIPRRADGSIALEELFDSNELADDADLRETPFRFDNEADIRSGEDGKEASLEIERRSAVPDAAPKADKPPKPKKPYELPPVSLLKIEPAPDNSDVRDELQTTAKKLVDTLTSFKVRTRITNISRGPTITRYELAPEEGVRVRSIANLVDDIALNLATTGVRIEAPIPGKSAVGIEVPNRVVATVHLRELLSHEKFKNAKSDITAALGMDVAGEPIFCDIAKMPHLLIAGTTGSGKSVCINSMIISLLYRASPDDMKLILVDPKKVELNVYNGLPHLLVPVVSDPKKAAGALHWAVTEMERRYELIETAGVRNLEGYNEYIKDVPADEEGNKPERLSRIVIVIDELADLMMTAPDEIEESICRIAQKARAAGMHLIIGTQRPSVDVITGLIKANVPSRIAFTVSNQMDSRIIIDVGGAEKLIGRGDMLYSPIGSTKPVRVQGTFVSDDEVADVCDFIKRQDYVAVYDDAVMNSIEEAAAMCGASKKGGKVSAISAPDTGEGEDGEDSMLKPAIELAVESGKISTSLIQRRLSLGYGRAAKLIDRMQEMGIVSPPEGQKPRNVLITKQQYMEMVLNRDIE